MSLTLNHELPVAESETGCDWASFSAIRDMSQHFWLCYRLHRDFLSVPPSYGVVEFIAETPTLEFELFEKNAYSAALDDTLAELSPGCYSWPDETDGMSFVSDHQVLEISFQSRVIHATQYHHESAQLALIHFLTQNLGVSTPNSARSTEKS